MAVEPITSVAEELIRIEFTEPTTALEGRAINMVSRIWRVHWVVGEFRPIGSSHMKNDRGSRRCRLVICLVTMCGVAGFFGGTLHVVGQTNELQNRGVQDGAGYDLIWYTVDNGGVMHAQSGNGQYELSGTIGQPAAVGPIDGLMAFSYELTVGFWFALAPSDCNADANVNLFDYRNLEGCLSGPGAGLPDPECRCFDVNLSGVVDLADFARHAIVFTGE